MEQSNHHDPTHLLEEVSGRCFALSTTSTDDYQEMRRHRKAWKALCDALDMLSEDERRAHLPMARLAADHIDKRIRVAPRAWLERAAGGAREPRLELVACLRVHTTQTITDAGRGLDEQTLANILHGAHLRNLEVLRIEDTTLSDRIIDVLLRAPCLTNLRELYLGRNLLGDQSLSKLSRAGALPRLEVLSLAGNQINHTGILEMLEEQTLRNLRELYLDENAITDACVQALAISSLGRRLEKLGLAGNEQITDHGLEALRARIEVGLPALEQLHLMGCGADDGKALALMRDVRELARQRTRS